MNTEQATSKFGDACQALMVLTVKLTTLIDRLIASCTEVAKANPDVPITFLDLRLSFYRHSGFSTYANEVKDFYNVWTGQSEKCMAKGKGTPKNAAAVGVQEALARIAKACEGDQISELMGWTDSTGKKDSTPSLAELKYYKKAVTKKDKQAEAPTKVVGQSINASKASNWDMNKVKLQLARIDTALADCESQEMVDQFATDVAALANSIITLVGIENSELQDKAMKTRHLVNTEVTYLPEKNGKGSKTNKELVGATS